MLLVAFPCVVEIYVYVGVKAEDKEIIIYSSRKEQIYIHYGYMQMEV